MREQFGEKVTLTGSNGVLAKDYGNVTVPAGAYQYANGVMDDINKYAKVTAYANADVAHSYNLLSYQACELNFSFVMGGNTGSSNGTKVAIVSTTRNTPYLTTRIQNTDTVQHVYAVKLFGFTS